MNKTLRLPDLDATHALGASLAACLQPGDVVCLSGPLGAGKTTLVRAILRQLTGDPELLVVSPSYTLMQTYETSRGAVHHFDLWRLDDPAALDELGWDEAKHDIVLVEWADRLGSRRCPEARSVTLSLIAESTDDARQAVLAGWPGPPG